MYSIWRATQQEWSAWAVTTLDDGSVRPATDQELLDRHVTVAGHDAEGGHVFFQVGRLQWSRSDFPGRPLTAGRAEERFQALPRAAKRACYRARVERAGGPLKRGRVKVDVPLAEVAEEDRLEEVFIPHRWLGER